MDRVRSSEIPPAERTVLYLPNGFMGGAYSDRRVSTKYGTLPRRYIVCDLSLSYKVGEKAIVWIGPIVSGIYDRLAISHPAKQVPDP